MVQTIPRGEAFAPLATLQALNLSSNITTWACDASYVVQNSHKLALQPQELRKTCLSSRHGDVWHCLQSYLSSGVLPLPTKVKSHIDFGSRSMSLEEYRQYFSNVIADAAATVASHIYDYASCLAKQVESYLTQSFLTCVRLAIVECRVSRHLRNNDVSRQTPLKVQSVTQEEFSQEISVRIRSLGHDLQRHLNGRHIVCLHCKNQFAKSDTKSWELLPCVGNHLDPPEVIIANRFIEGSSEPFVGRLQDC